MPPCNNPSSEYSTAALQLNSDKLADKTRKLIQILTRHYHPNSQKKSNSFHVSFAHYFALK